MESIFDQIKYKIDKYRYRDANNVLFFWKKNNVVVKQYHNFGDYLSLVIVGEILRTYSLITPVEYNSSNKKLFAIGSILHFAKDGDVIWGSGVNGKIANEEHSFSSLDVRMVRGPLTKKFLNDKGIEVNSVYGDPALLLPYLFPKIKRRPIKNKFIVIPNLNELDVCSRFAPKHISVVSPLNYWRNVVEEIVTSEIVLASSLHGLILAEVFGVPVRFYKPSISETLFKYQDYLLGTGRDLKEVPPTFQEKFSENSGITFESPKFDVQKMLGAFPRDLFIPKYEN